MSARQDDVMFILGAGASVKAGVPDTYGLVDSFEKSLDASAPEKRTLTSILEVLRIWTEEHPRISGGRVDVERLLETLERLLNKDSEVILKFCKDSDLKLQTADIEPLLRQLKKFIRQKMFVPQNRIDYLQPFVSFILDNHPLDIFSFNYDTCIEQFCVLYHRSYVDGFDINWNIEVFNKDVDVRLYKLHGSIIWYKTDKGNYVRLLVHDDKDEIPLVTGETAKTLILYPMRKVDFAEPLLELLVELKKKLGQAKIVVVIGYSFRDDQITQLFWDAASKNSELVLVLISPSAHKVYEERLRFRDQDNLRKVPSSLENRVLVLPYEFEKIFARFEEDYFKVLRMALEKEETPRTLYIKKYDAQWKEVLGQFIDCEYMAKVNEIIPKFASWDDIIQETGVIDYKYEIINSFKSIINSVYLEDKEGEKVWTERFLSSLGRFSTSCRIVPAPGGNLLHFEGTIGNTETNPRNMVSFLLEGITWLSKKLPIMLDNRKVMTWRRRVEDLRLHFEKLSARDLTYQTYAKIMEHHVTGPDELVGKCDEHRTTSDERKRPLLVDEVNSIFQCLERREIESILTRFYE